MAKKTKTKKEIKVDEPKQAEVSGVAKAEDKVAVSPAPVPPPTDPSLVNVSFSQDELMTFANLLSISAQTYQNLALAAAQQNDEALFGVLSARQKLSYMLATKLANNSNIGEPISRDVH